jgi:hypothetical protein
MAYHYGGPGLIQGQFMRGLWWTKSHLDSFFSRRFGFSCQYYSISASYSSSCVHCSYQKDKWAKPGNCVKSNAFSEHKHRIEEYFHLELIGLILL